jgi:hypothetical protein
MWILHEGCGMKSSNKYYDLLVALSHAKQKVYDIEQAIEQLLEEQASREGGN